MFCIKHTNQWPFQLFGLLFTIHLYDSCPTWQSRVPASHAPCLSKCERIRGKVRRKRPICQAFSFRGCARVANPILSYLSSNCYNQWLLEIKSSWPYTTLIFRIFTWQILFSFLLAKHMAVLKYHQHGWPCGHITWVYVQREGAQWWVLIGSLS